MKLRKLDKRFRIYNMGLATHYISVNPAIFVKVKDAMEIAYGDGLRVFFFMEQDTDKSDWFYTYHSSGQSAHFRIYFRREEQASYLTLKMSR